MTASESFSTQCQRRVDGALATALANPDYPPLLQEAMHYACLNGGKRIRPQLVYGACLALAAPLERADNAACAVEMIHSYSLAHDDLPAMDDDDLRRGKPSLHRAYDDATAILVGDGLQSLAFQLLSEPVPGLDSNQQLAMLQVLAQAAGPAGMVGGQMLDFHGVGKTLDREQLEQLHRLKTGALIQASVMLGGLCSDAISDPQLHNLAEFGAAIGLAFQVQDDILDETSDTDTLGKPQGSDQRHNKPTYVSLLGLDEARRLCGALTAQALSSLESFGPAAQHLRDLAEYLRERSH